MEITRARVIYRIKGEAQLERLSLWLASSVKETQKSLCMTIALLSSICGHDRCWELRGLDFTVWSRLPQIHLSDSIIERIMLTFSVDPLFTWISSFSPIVEVYVILWPLWPSLCPYGRDRISAKLEEGVVCSVRVTELCDGCFDRYFSTKWIWKKNQMI
jgi:hypothetical protein